MSAAGDKLLDAAQTLGRLTPAEIEAFAAQHDIEAETVCQAVADLRQAAFVYALHRTAATELRQAPADEVSTPLPGLQR